MGYVLPRGLSEEEKLRTIVGLSGWYVRPKDRAKAMRLLKERYACEWPGCLGSRDLPVSTTLLNDNVLSPSPWPDGEKRLLCRRHGLEGMSHLLLSAVHNTDAGEEDM